ncbi:MAG: hypothetical protein JNL57_03490 [Bacteroidetes bacterium]|nr:hypothetical protein [Bacteroidota bacterium]
MKILIPTMLAGFISLSSSGGRTDDRTGAPGSASNCSNGGFCHAGGSLSASMTIGVTEKGKLTPVTSYKAGTTYTIAIATVSSFSVSKGFQATVLDVSNNASGTLSGASAGSSIISANSRSLAVQSSASSLGIWTFDWTAPANPTGSVTIYAAGVAGNSSNSESGDQAVTKTATLTLDNSSGLSQSKATEVNIFPNPASDYLHITIPCKQVGLTNTSGKRILVPVVGGTADLRLISPGTYQLDLLHQGKRQLQKLVIVNH